MRFLLLLGLLVNAARADNCARLCGLRCNNLQRCTVNYDYFGFPESCECNSILGELFGGLFGTFVTIAIVYYLIRWCYAERDNSRDVYVEETPRVIYVEEAPQHNSIQQNVQMVMPVDNRHDDAKPSGPPIPSPSTMSSSPFISKVESIRTQLGLSASLNAKETIEQAETMLDLPSVPNASLPARLEALLVALGLA